MMMLAQPSAHLIHDIVYLKPNNYDSHIITNGWCAQDIFTSFFNVLSNCKSTTSVHILKEQLELLLASIFLDSDSESSKMINLFYKLIAYTRDIKGLGHYTHSYMLVVELFKFGNKYEKQVNKDVIQNNAYLILETFAKKYGSWKDIKYFLNYYVEELHKDKKTDLDNDFFIKKIVKMVCKQMKEDSNSLIAKWLPREKSNKFGWLTPLFAREYYSEWFSESMSAGQYKAATRKALTHFRQLISKLNKQLDTTQTIDLNKNVTKKSFNCINKIMNWETIVKELTNIRYNDLDNLKQMI
jgi:hypothetical protein